jgi:hypothetical protein
MSVIVAETKRGKVSFLCYLCLEERTAFGSVTKHHALDSAGSAD